VCAVTKLRLPTYVEEFFISPATKILSMKPIITLQYKATTPVAMAGHYCVFKKLSQLERNRDINSEMFAPLSLKE
jgi:hypothetical protein